MSKCCIALHLIEYKMQYIHVRDVHIISVINMVICGPAYDFSGHKNSMPLDRCMKIYDVGILTLFG